MLDSGTKPPENRIHLFDPVGLINEGYGGTYRSSNYAVKPRRPTKSYGNFEEVATNGGLKSYDSFNTDENGVGALRSYDSYTDPINPGLRSYDSFSMETSNGGNTRSYDHNNNNNNDDDNVNGLELRFGVHDNNNNNNNNGEMDEDYDVSTPRMWKPSSPTSPNKSLNSSSYFQNNNSFNSTNSINNSGNSSPFHPRNSSPLHPSSVKPMNNNININNNSSVISVNSMALNPSSPRHNYPQNMSPSSRTQAIAKGRRELMDMVRDLPESFYELSLKDIVDKKTEYGVQKGVGVGVDISEEKKGVRENGIKPLETKTMKKKSKKVKKSESKKQMVVRGKNVDRGRFLLRTSVFPIFSRSKKNKKRMVNGSSFKVAPMSKPNPASNGSMKVVEKDWWGRKTSIESDDGNGLRNKSESSESSGISSRSSSSNGRFRDRFLPTCCLFNGRKIRSKK